MTSERTLVYPVGDDESPSEATVLAVAEHLDENAAEIEPELHDRIDPDALDRLTGSDGVVIEFQYHGRQIRVHNETQVEVRPA